jgi:hypothetical protein
MHAMIERGMLDRIWNATCAIGVLQSTGNEAGQGARQGHHWIFGSGFLIGKKRIATSPQVVKHVKDVGLPADQIHVQFTYRRADGEMVQACRPVVGMCTLDKNEIEIGVMEVNLEADDEARWCQPVPIIPRIEDVRLSEPIGILGFPAWTELPVDEKACANSVSRIGPLLFQRCVAGFFPREGVPGIHRVIVDLLGADGLFGSPVFRSETGEVIGVFVGTNIEGRIDDGKKMGDTVESGHVVALDQRKLLELNEKCDRANQRRK